MRSFFLMLYARRRIEPLLSFPPVIRVNLTPAGQNRPFPTIFTFFKKIIQ